MNGPLTIWTGWTGTAFAAALVAIWGWALAAAYLQSERAAERPPGTRRRIAGALIGLHGAPLPLCVWLQPEGSALLILAGLLVLTQQAAAALTFAGAHAAWRTLDQAEPPEIHLPGGAPPGAAAP